MSRKVFTAGEVLAAADVNSFLMDQTVMSFAGTAARGSAIPSPTLGMYTHLEDTPARTQFWNGSAWVSPFGMTLLESRTFSAASLIRFNNIFSATYDNYFVDYNVNTSASNPVSLMRFLTATDTPTTGTTYNNTGFSNAVGFLNNYAGNNGSTILAGISSGSNGSNSLIRIMNPFLTTPTGTSANVLQHDATTRYDQFISEQTTRSFPGFQIATSTGTVTGTIRIYGMRNS
jgi:hypothetical protein